MSMLRYSWVPVTVLWVIWLVIFVVSVWDRGQGLESWGQFGDSFGFLNTLFTGLAFSAAAYGVYRQNKQLKDEQQERDSRDFESRFFFFLKLLVQMTDSMEHTWRKQGERQPTRYKGREALKQILENLSPEAPEAGKRKSWDDFKYKLNPYMDLVVQIVEFIEKKKPIVLSNNEREEYARYIKPVLGLHFAPLFEYYSEHYRGVPWNNPEELLKKYKII